VTSFFQRPGWINFIVKPVPRPNVSLLRCRHHETQVVCELHAWQKMCVLPCFPGLGRANWSVLARHPVCSFLRSCLRRVRANCSSSRRNISALSRCSILENNSWRHRKAVFSNRQVHKNTKRGNLRCAP
jgi:hypothetical protein